MIDEATKHNYQRESMTSRETPSFLTLKNADTLLNQAKPRDQMLFFSIRNDLFPLHLNTYVMDLQQL